MTLLPFLYALLAALTGISSGVIVGEPRVAASSVRGDVQAVATAVLAARPTPTASFEALRGAPAAMRVATVAPLAPRTLPLAERPARRRE